MQRNRAAAFVLGMLLLTLPASGTLTFCLDGTAPNCCGDGDRTVTPSPDTGTRVGTGVCDCCFAVDALPFDRGSSTDRFLATHHEAGSGLVVHRPFRRLVRADASHPVAAAPSPENVVLRV